MAPAECIRLRDMMYFDCLGHVSGRPTLRGRINGDRYRLNSICLARIPAPLLLFRC